MEFQELLGMINNHGEPRDKAYWGLALSGEVGELNNCIKKEIRDDADYRDEIKGEIADSFNYLVLLAKEYGIDMEKAILEKIVEINVKAKMQPNKRYEIVDYGGKD